MDCRIDWSPEAVEDVSAIAEYIARDSYQYSVQRVTNSSVGRASETVPELIAGGVKIAADIPY